MLTFLLYIILIFVIACAVFAFVSDRMSPRSVKIVGGILIGVCGIFVLLLLSILFIRSIH